MVIMSKEEFKQIYKTLPVTIREALRQATGIFLAQQRNDLAHHIQNHDTLCQPTNPQLPRTIGSQ